MRNAVCLVFCVMMGCSDAPREIQSSVQQVRTGEDGSLGLDLLLTDGVGLPLRCGPGKVVASVSVKPRGSSEAFTPVPDSAVVVQCMDAGRGDVAVVADNSGSEAGYLENLKHGVRNIVNNVVPLGGRASLTRVSTNASVLSEMTGDKWQVHEAISSMWVANGWTALNDGIRLGNETLAAAAVTPENGFCTTSRKMAVVVFTDGRENNSHDDHADSYSIDQYPGDGINTTVADLKELNVDEVTTPLYIVGLGDEVDHETLVDLAESTNGRYLPIGSADELPYVFDVISNYLNDGYRVCADLSDQCGDLTAQVEFVWSDDIGRFYRGVMEADVHVPCQEKKLVSVDAGSSHTCMLRSDGEVRCLTWNYNDNTRILFGNKGLAGKSVDLGGKAVQVSSGVDHVCALMDNGGVRCWGEGSLGQLGYGTRDDVGLLNTPAEMGDIDLGGRAVQISAGFEQTCALMESGAVRCWGNGYYGMGYGNRENVGDDETPASVGDISLGEPAVQVDVGVLSACAVLIDGSVKCWGDSRYGKLGQTLLYRPGKTSNIGDDEMLSEVPPVLIGARVSKVSAGGPQTCVVLEGGGVKCWGSDPNGYGILGYAFGKGVPATIGDDDTPADFGNVSVGGVVVDIAADGTASCALIDNGDVRCWGHEEKVGRGRGGGHVGDDELPSEVDPVSLGGRATAITNGGRHSCATLDTGKVSCWGYPPPGIVQVWD